MMFRIALGLLLLLTGCSGNRQTAKNVTHVGNATNQQTGPKSGLRIENGINRGMKINDSTGLTYIPVTFTNDSTVPIHLQIAFAKEYDHPHPDSDDKFKVILLSEEWTESLITDSLIDDLKNHLDKPFFNETLEPGEKLVTAIGTLRPAPAQICGIIPNALFSYSDRELYLGCDSLMNPNYSVKAHLKLGIKLDFCHIGGVPEGCFIIPCGQISYHGY